MSETATHEQHIRDWYRELCAAIRREEVANRDTLCAHCGKARKDHHYSELKCTLCVSSWNFLAVNADEMNKVFATVNALERLAEACGWSL